MPVIVCVKRPIPVRMAGPWDGTPERAREIIAFVGNTGPNETPGFIGDGPDGLAQVYDQLHTSWINVPVGSYIARGTEGEHYPIAAGVWARTYDVVGAE
ncbi:hypothetical protein [Frankia sp. AgB32]|uniref:hypothetical protein n=1 Tax=Frankia sp. AgB32 TaxID=631119 RepID=UPI00200F7B57|nr:hypothetical protein [Frankia sp. AgB32]MCK9894703.1 hypothetical protein [Frankia sp. AgB32]